MLLILIFKCLIYSFCAVVHLQNGIGETNVLNSCMQCENAIY